MHFVKYSREDALFSSLQKSFVNSKCPNIMSLMFLCLLFVYDRTLREEGMESERERERASE
jgi:hypothetical protein